MPTKVKNKRKKPDKIYIIIDNISGEVWNGFEWVMDSKDVLIFDTEKQALTAFNNGLNKKLGTMIVTVDF